MNKELFINKLSASIHNTDPNATVYLFGSRARNDFHENSDWDLLILVNELKITNEVEDRFRDSLYDIELESGQIISTLIYSKDYWNSTMTITPLYKDVIKEGIRI